MTAQKAGLKFEKDVAADVEHNTTDDTRVVFGGGTSGNVRIPQPDLHITTLGAGLEIYNIEIKRSTQDRFYIEAEDFEQLAACCNEYTQPVFMMKFTFREPVVLVFASQKAVSAETAALELPECFDPHVTKSGSLRLSKPDTEDWPSSQAGRQDYEVLMSVIGITD